MISIERPLRVNFVDDIIEHHAAEAKPVAGAPKE